MVKVVYRTDSRGPTELKKGFEAWVPLSAKQAQAFVLRYCGGIKKKVNQALPKKTEAVLSRLEWTNIKIIWGETKSQFKQIVTELDKARRLWPNDLSRLIISQKSQDTSHVSTALDTNCGGFSEGYDYKIEFPKSLKSSVMYDTTLGYKVGIGNIVRRTQWPQIVLSGDTLEASNIIGIKQKGLKGGEEISFLTSIDPQYIVGYKKSSKRSAPWIPFHKRKKKR